METFYCPLCKQEVSRSVFEKITGVWEEKEKRLAALKTKEKALIQREEKMTEKFRREKKQINISADLKLKRTLEQKTREFNKSLQQQKLELRRARAKIESDYKKKLADEANKILTSEKLKQEHLRSELREKFETESKRKIDEAKRSLEKDKIFFDREKKLQLNRYNQLNKQFAAMQNKSKAEINQREIKIKQLEEQLKKNETPQVLGLLNEKDMLKTLQNRFPNDKFDHTGKGGDIVHHIMMGEREVGILVYELKKVSHFHNDHIDQALKAKQQRNADYALLITNARRSKNDFGFSIAKNVIIVHPAGALTIISILRDHLITISKLQLSNKQRDETTKAVLEYIQSPSFKNNIESIISQTIELYASLKKEVKDHVNTWQDRFERYSDINSKAYSIENKIVRLVISKDESKGLQRGIIITPIELPAEIK